MKPDVLVIGGGAAGIFAAWNAARHGAKVLLIEKTDRLGTKILISGGGKCNVAHDGSMESVLKAFRPNEARFIRPACHLMPNQAIIDFFTERGLEVYTRPDGRVFPVWQTAKDVVAILEHALAEARVQIWHDCPVTRVLADDGRVTGIETPRGVIECRHIVLSVGGSSYPKTGSTGDGWPWAKELGHSIVKVKAALAPMYLELDTEELKAGIALRHVLLKARLAGKEIARWRADLLFTHKGVSGPSVLGISRVVAERFGEGEITLEIDLLADETFETLSANLKNWVAANQRKGITTFLDTIVPSRLEPDLLAAAGLENVPAQTVGKKGLNRLVEVLKGWKIGTVRSVPLEKGEVVAGGISLDEVDPRTMRSLKCQGLYPCGEILDVAGPVGGYNLQAAFATGFLAGKTAAEDALEDRG